MSKVPARARTHPNEEAFPRGLSGPALRALATAGIRSMAELARHSKDELAGLHGMGPKGIRMLEEALAATGRRFRDPSVRPPRGPGLTGTGPRRRSSAS